jgi:hypothetical protein
MSDEQQLAQLVRTRYPFPISHAYGYMENRIDAGDRYLATLACFEVTLKYVASIALASFVRDVQQDTSLESARLFQDLFDVLSRPLSLGHWQQLLQLTLWPYHEHKERLVVPELFDFYYRITDNGKVRAQKGTVRTIQHLIQERNEEAHHRNRVQITLLQRQIGLATLEEELRTLLQHLRFLADYELFYVEHAEHRGGVWHYRANQMNGASYPFRQTVWKTPHSISAHRCMLRRQDATATLDLYPFLVITEEGRLQQPDLFFYDGIFSSGKACFMGHYVNDYIEPADESSPCSVASDAVISLLGFLQRQIPRATDSEPDDIAMAPTASDIYGQAVRWSWEHGQRQWISLEALRQLLSLSREDALQQERALEMEHGIQVEPEAEVPFEGEPTWANLAYYVLESGEQEEMHYRDIAAEAAQLRDQHDPNWKLGDTTYVEASVNYAMSLDPRFYKVRRGHYRLTKRSELLSNPSWANLAYFVLKHYGQKGTGMHFHEIAEHAIKLKEKYSDWRRSSAQTPANTVSAAMSVDHRFRSRSERGVWGLAEWEEGIQEERAGPVPKQPPARGQVYEGVLARLGELGALEQLPFGRTYYVLDGKAHLMFRFSREHNRSGEYEYFMGVTPQYFERIRQMGNGFMVFVLGAPDNVLIVPAETFAEWIRDTEPSGSGTWPLGFYQTGTRDRTERWVPGAGREDVSPFLNNYDDIRQALSPTGFPKKGRRRSSSVRMPALFTAGLVRPGDKIYVQNHPDAAASVIDPKWVEYREKRLTYNDWGMQVTGWSSINIYRSTVLARTEQTLEELRRKLQESDQSGAKL